MGDGQLQEGVASLEGLEGAQLEQFVSVPEHFEHLYEHKGQEFIDKYLPSGQDVQLFEFGPLHDLQVELQSEQSAIPAS